MSSSLSNSKYGNLRNIFQEKGIHIQCRTNIFRVSRKEEEFNRVLIMNSRKSEWCVLRSKSRITKGKVPIVCFCRAYFVDTAQQSQSFKEKKSVIFLSHILLLLLKWNFPQKCKPTSTINICTYFKHLHKQCIAYIHLSCITFIS